MSQTTVVSEPPGYRSPRWLWIALVVSVAINLLLVGLMAGAAWFRHRTGIPYVTAANHFAFIRSLPRERRDALRQVSRDQLASARPLWQAVREARRETDRLLAAEPFDAVAFLAAHRALLEKENAARQAGSQILADTIARLTPDERRRMTGWRERHRSHWRGETAPSRDSSEGKARD